LWLSNNEWSYKFWREAADEAWNRAAIAPEIVNSTFTRREAARLLLGTDIKEALLESAPTELPNLMSDLLLAALDDVDWLEIADDHLDEFDEDCDSG
jgi:hypothetical protein